MVITSSGLLDRIRVARADLGGAAARVADVLLADPGRAAEMTIGALADTAGSSAATVTRLCRRLGLDGYAALRVGLAAEAGRATTAWQSDIGDRLTAGDSLDRVLSVLARADSDAIRDTAGRLDVTALGAACLAVAGARRTDIYGVGGSAVVATELQLRLHRIGVASWVWGEVHSALTSAAVLDERDVAIAFSDTGQTRETAEPLRLARSRGATTIAITGDPGSPIAAAAELVLLTTSSSVSLRPDNVSARHSQLLVLDCLYIGVAQRTYDRTVTSLESTSAAVDSFRARSAGRRSGSGRQLA
ncbi:MAG: MurR/RpiR family transcriptional regulator [Nakamurella sp.]